MVVLVAVMMRQGCVDDEDEDEDGDSHSADCYTRNKSICSNL